MSATAAVGWLFALALLPGVVAGALEVLDMRRAARRRARPPKMIVLPPRWRR